MGRLASGLCVIAALVLLLLGARNAFARYNS